MVVKLFRLAKRRCAWPVWSSGFSLCRYQGTTSEVAEKPFFELALYQGTRLRVP